MSLFPAPDSGFNLGDFNPSYFTKDEDLLTYGQAERTYLKMTGGTITGGLTIGGNLDIQTLSVAGSSVSLSSITGITAGTTAASKALVLDSSSVLSGTMTLRLDTNAPVINSSNASLYPFSIRRITTSIGDGGMIAFLNTTTVPTGTTPGGAIGFIRNAIGNGASDFSVQIRATGLTTDGLTERLRINSDGTTSLTGSLTISGATTINNSLTVNGTPVFKVNSGSFGCQIQATNNSSVAGFIAPSNDNSAVFFGTTSSTPIAFYCGSEQMRINSNGCVGIGTTANNYPLNIATSVGEYITSIHSALFSSGLFTNQSNVSYSVSLRCAQAAMAGAFIARSDRRIKKDFTPVEYDMVNAFIEHVEPCLYRLKETNEPCLGYITQDIMKILPHGLITYEEAVDLPVEQEGDVENRLLLVQYTRICCLLHIEAKKQRERIAELERQMALLMSRPVNKKWAEKQS